MPTDKFTSPHLKRRARPFPFLFKSSPVARASACGFCSVDEQTSAGGSPRYKSRKPALLFNPEFYWFDKKLVAHLHGDIVPAWLDLWHLHRNLVFALLDDGGFVIILVVGQVHGGN